jgi:hypothetical protein
MQRFRTDCTAFCSAYLRGSFLIVGIGDLQVVLLSNGRAVANPFAHHMQRKGRYQFGFSARPEIVERLAPRFDACPFANPL